MRGKKLWGVWGARYDRYLHGYGSELRENRNYPGRYENRATLQGVAPTGPAGSLPGHRPTAEEPEGQTRPDRGAVPVGRPSGRHG